jgi:uncharacterized membrane protein YhaH (DUF805 family)
MPPLNQHGYIFITFATLVAAYLLDEALMSAGSFPLYMSDHIMFSQNFVSFCNLLLLINWGWATLRRMTDCGVSKPWFVFYFIPLANIGLAIALMVAPTKGENV